MFVVLAAVVAALAQMPSPISADPNANPFAPRSGPGQGINLKELPANPELEAKITRVSPDELRTFMSRKPAPLIVDTRDRSAWLGEHIPGAISVSLYDFPSQWHTFPRNRLIALYCT